MIKFERPLLKLVNGKSTEVYDYQNFVRIFKLKQTEEKAFVVDTQTDSLALVI